MRLFYWAMLPATLLPFTLGCGEDAGEGPGNGPSPPVGGAMATGGAESSPGIKQIMVRLTKGPTSLTPILGDELKQAEPAWETIQGQTKEYAQLAAEMGKYDPPKGSKESWTKLASAYAESAADLDKSARAKDKEAALAAHGQITNSCMACHREHRAMGPGMGGPPGGMRGGPPGGPPPGAGPK